MMKVLVGYPTEDEEFVIVQRVTGMTAAIGAVTSTEELLAMQAEARKVYIDPVAGDLCRQAGGGDARAGQGRPARPCAASFFMARARAPPSA